MESKERFKDIYYNVLRTRFLEESLIEEAKKGTNIGSFHCCVGQEAAGVAACAALKPEDVVTTTHRGHAHYIGKGCDLKKLCCDFWGKKGGYSKGRAGHMIVFDKEHNMLGGTGIVGGNLPLGVGHALCFQLRKEKRIAMSCFGDGSTNTGSFHESLNLAAKWKLPIVFFCETNQYGLTCHVDDQLSCKDVVDRAKSYDIPGVSVFGNDIEQVYTTMTEVVEKVRSGEGPILVEAKTYRICGFATTDIGGYQREDEMAYWKGKDAVIIAEKFLADNEICSKKMLSELRDKAISEVKEAIEYALNAPDPEPLNIPFDLYEGGK